MDMETRQLGTEQCNIQKIGSKFRDIFADKLENLYCLTDVDVTIEGHITYDVYSYFYVLFYPCVNGKNGRNNCQPYEEVVKKLGSTFLTVKMQDIELTPQIYKNPIQVRSRELSAPVMENLYNNINAYFHIISIETDNDILGFEVYSDVDVKRYFKYDVTFMVNSMNQKSPLISGEAYCNILLQLTEQMITINRTYTKLIEVLGDVGGLMEFVFSFLKILSLFLTEALYEKGIVNNLFSFDLDKKIITVKFQNNKNNNILNNSPTIDHPEIYRVKPSFKLSSQDLVSSNETRNKNILSDDLNKLKISIDSPLKLENSKKIIKKKKIKIKKKSTSKRISKF